MVFKELERRKREKKRGKKLSYTQMTYVVFMKAIDRGLFGYDKREDFPKFLAETFGRGHGSVYQMKNIINSKRRPFSVKVQDVKVNLLRIREPKYKEKYSQIWLQYGENCAGFSDTGDFVTGLMVGPNEYLEWLESHPFRKFIENFASAAEKRMVNESDSFYDLYNPDNTLVKEAKMISFKGITELKEIVSNW